MPLAAACPDAITLRNYHLGQTSWEEAEEIERHLEGCGRCAETLHALGGADTLVVALRQWASRPPPPEEPEVASLISALSQVAPPVDPATVALDPTPPAREPAPADPAVTQEEYSFLGP